MLELAEVLSEIKKNDNNYDVRYNLVFEALHLALKKGYNAGVRIDSLEPEWPVVYIELPTGQVSWHIPQHNQQWDGHSTEDKYRRIDHFVDQSR